MSGDLKFMVDMEQAIINFLKDRGELSTSQIVANVAADEYALVHAELTKQEFADPQKQRTAKRKKAQLHRKILYYLHKLTSENVLRISGQGHKGEKKYVLDLDPDQELVIGKKYHKTNRAQLQLPPLPVDQYEEQHVIKKFAEDSFIEQVNSIVFNAQSFVTLTELEQMIDRFLPTINDALCIHHFEHFFADHPPSTLFAALISLQTKCSDFDKRLTLIIDPERAAASHVIPLVKRYLESGWDRITLVFAMAPGQFFLNQTVDEILTSYMQHKRPIYFINKRICTAPCFTGRAGAYSLTNEEWELYEREGQSRGIVLGQSAIIIDMCKYFLESGKDMRKLEDFMRKIMHSFLISNNVQRRRSTESFQYTLDLNRDQMTDLFAYAKNYVRFWNYGWKMDGIDQAELVALLQRLKKSVDTFTQFERIIYLSCGMPMRFTIAFASAAETCAQGLTAPKFKTVYINDLSDFERKDIKDIIAAKEALFQCFDGGDVMSLNQSRAKTVKEVTLEIGHVLAHTRIPFFRYDFARIKEKHVQLSAFLS